MESFAELEYLINEGYETYRSASTVDCAIFGYHEGEVKLLLVKNKILIKWVCPGGYIKKTESLDEAAARITMERTGIQNLFLKQFKAFGNPGRNSAIGSFDEQKLYELTGLTIGPDNWLMEETITIGFYAITNIVVAEPKPDALSSECAWFSANDLPDLGFDHNELVKAALFAMRTDLYHFPIGKSLLQQKFTLKEIKTLYEVLSGKELNRTNFAKKLISLGLLLKLGEKRHIGAHRSPTYYQFNETAYENALVEGLVLI